MEDLERSFNIQKEYFKKGHTKDLDFRINKLKLLKKIIKENEEKILEALKKDLAKSYFEGYMAEIGVVYDEINLHIKKLKSFAKRKRVKSSIVYFPSKNYIYKEPYGVVLIIGPFNYPFQLLIAPLIGAISAGNCAILKPSEASINTAKALEEIINNNFKEEYIKVVAPSEGKEAVSKLLSFKFDYIFFTGSIKVGKIVMKEASKNLIPVTLELGGKSPCIIDKDANLKLAAKRIVWGKLLNAGQTCVAPDYLAVHKEIEDEFLNLLVKEIELQYGKNPEESPDFPRIIRESDAKRLSDYLNCGELFYGGEVKIKDKYVSPTILKNVDLESPIMQEEIFGPIFPILTFEKLENIIEFIEEKEKPLALYYFSESREKIDYILKNTSSGGVTINDTVIHVATPNLPFGGVGNSGIGAYHGEESYLTFSHKKSVLVRGTFIEFPIRFAPFKNKLQLLRKVMK